MSKKILLLVLSFMFIISVIQPVYSVGLAHGQLKHYFEPNKEITVAFQVIHIKPGTEANVYLEGELKEYSTMSEIDETGRFTVTVKLPENLDTPGVHGVLAIAAEVPIDPAKTMIATLTTVRVPIRIIVPYDGPYLELKDFHATDAGISQNVLFRTWVINWGTEAISDAKAKVDVYDPDGNYVTAVTTDEYTVNLEEEVEMSSLWNTSELVRGIYTAKSTITYADQSETSKTVEFRVGELLVSIEDYTTTLEIDGVQPFEITVKNEWSESIQNVYGTVVLDDKEFKTTPVDLGMFEDGKLTAHVDTSTFQEGTVDGKITIFFGEDKKTTIKDIKVHFVKKAEEQKATGFNISTNIILVIVIVLIIIIFILILLFFLFLRRTRPRRRR